MVFGNHINDKNVFISPKKTSSKALSRHQEKLRRTHSITGSRERKKYNEKIHLLIKYIYTIV